MSDSNESYDGSSSEESDGMTSSESDCDVKNLTFPNRGLRWPVGSPKPKNPVRGTRWNKSKGLRLDSKDQQDMGRYVPGRMPKLIRKGEALIAADYKEGGNGSTRAICEVCKQKIPFSTDLVEESKELMEHVLKCWAPNDLPPMGLYDEREKKPTVTGHLAVEEDEDCLLFSIQSPGLFGGAYMMVLAFPLRMQPGLDMLDATLRREWFHEECPHMSMFAKRETEGSAVSAEEEIKMFSFKENNVTATSKKNADAKFLESSTKHYHRPGKVVWAREYKGVFWPAIMMEEEGTGILARRDPDEDEEESWDRYFSLQWHVVFLGRGGKRMWARDCFDTFSTRFRGTDEIETWMDKDKLEILSLEGEEKSKWEEAVVIANKMVELDSDEEVLEVVAKLGLTGGGEMIKDSSLWEMLVDEFGEEEAKSLLEKWRNDPGEHKWSFFKNMYKQNSDLPFPLPVDKVEGFSYWPLMGVEKGSEDQRKEWEKLLVPDRTEMSLEEIFTKPGETGIYEYHLVDGFRSRCKVVFHGKMIIRTRGEVQKDSLRESVDQGSGVRERLREN